MPDQEFPKLYLYRRIVQAKLFIDAHSAERIDATDIADEACYSKYHFIRTFRDIYGKTPHQYLTAVRVDKAKALLETGMPVTEVCLSVGFDSLGSFTGLFKRRTGVTPSTFQRERLARRQRMDKAPLSFVPGCFAALYSGRENSNTREAT
ncbi:AraC-like DNA-binding protein [Granulicella aggregans]|uniref:AraC-like DNA-binding protein n=1 Tax=Granulicella aggregans TaxID=474949 RepID=A0A7W7Z9Q1_9BACT|nr:helix-turn-helix transcriptional regulator [Granulicella aggregans]MBB5055860.1 AraC-like DNA-binding protein [Granulicella aggregans]